MTSAPIPILLYHSVGTQPAPLLRDWSVTPETFRAHLGRLVDDGFTGLTVTELVTAVRSGAALPERPVVVTFDDGFSDVAEYAAPALAQCSMPATLYVSTAYLGGVSTWLGPDGEQPMLTWDSVRDLADAGVEIGAHAHHHWALDELPTRAAETEIRESKGLLEDAVGRPLQSFAYPHGYHSRRLQQVVRDAGFTSACGVKHATSGIDDDLFALARIIVPHDATGADLVRLMTTLGRAPRRERLRTKGWRAARRLRARTRRRPDAVSIP